MDDKHNMARCKQCDHLLSFHGEDGCGTWLLGVRAVPLYRCACVVSVAARPKNFPVISTQVGEMPSVSAKAENQTSDENHAQVAKLRPASEAAPSNATRDRLMDVASELRRTAEELKELENMLDKAIDRLASPPPPPPERRSRPERRRRHFAMTVDRRVGDRRKPEAVV